MSTPVAVVGAGSWGTALASVLARNGHDVVLWALEPDVAREINESRVNGTYLPGIVLPEGLRATTDLADTVGPARVVVSVVPSQFAGSVIEQAVTALRSDAILVSASKGIELSTLRRMDQVMEEILTPAQAHRFSVLSGPSFAAEVARQAPTAVVAASAEHEAAERVQALFQNPTFRVYTNPDVVGVELGGALKNVIALAAGVAAGLGFGHNTLAALITRGLAEITRLGVAMGARRETFSGLAGMGDLVLTCTGDLSRNRTVGVRLGQGEALEDILGEMRSVAEGVKTAEAVVALADRHGVEMPIATEVHAMLTAGRRPREALENLMSRDPKPEEWS
ncbi:MAG: NAD(P)-dependent glycerol-3-phosphate dehydrogenase [Gemmatimonadetes bacterium]|nr:NAD(P)-dependent glycerol-3-phosphate dehydrogenase [Gemmatimonadota bacterium]NNK64469.1 NAD(P)-dependent glycerol-3-phosphate dehydrogenase [Gemmatimonadota bacterium]